MSEMFSILAAPHDGTPILAFNSDLSIVEVIRWDDGVGYRNGAFTDEREPGWVSTDWSDEIWARGSEPAGWVALSPEIAQVITSTWPKP